VPYRAVGAVVAHEGPLCGGGGQRSAILPEGIVLPVVAHPEVVAVDMGARGDRFRRHPDHLAVARDGRARREIDERNLVAPFHLGLRGDPELGEGTAGRHVLEGDRDVVGRVKADHAGGVGSVMAVSRGG
jgi:hypothetical protein